VHIQRTAVAALPALLSAFPAHAEDAAVAEAKSSAAAKVTDRVALTFLEQSSPTEKTEFNLVVGLFGEDAPASVSMFKSLVAGTLDAPCNDQIAASEEEALERNALAKRSVYKQCLSAEAEPVSYDSSQVGVFVTRAL